MSRAENAAIEAALVERMGTKAQTEGTLTDAGGNTVALPEGVTPVPEYSTKNSKKELLEIAAKCGLTLDEAMKKAEMVEAIDKHIAEHWQEEPEQPQETPQSEQPQEDTALPQEPEACITIPLVRKTPGRIMVTYNGYVNIRREPSMERKAICGQVKQGKVLDVRGTVEANGLKWYVDARGVYILADAKLVHFTPV